MAFLAHHRATRKILFIILQSFMITTLLEMLFTACAKDTTETAL